MDGMDVESFVSGAQRDTERAGTKNKKGLREGSIFRRDVKSSVNGIQRRA